MVEPELNYHDIIEAEDLGSSRLRLLRVIQRSDLLVASAVLSTDFIDSAEMQSALEWLSRQGGYWQRDLEGILILSIPKDVEPDFSARWDHVADLHKRGLTHPGARAHERDPAASALLLELSAWANTLWAARSDRRHGSAEH